MNRAVDCRSDLYSLGITYYQLLTGRLPFMASDAIGWVHCHVARKPAPPMRFRDALPAALLDPVPVLEGPETNVGWLPYRPTFCIELRRALKPLPAPWPNPPSPPLPNPDIDNNCEIVLLRHWLNLG